MRARGSEGWGTRTQGEQLSAFGLVVCPGAHSFRQNHDGAQAGMSKYMWQQCFFLEKSTSDSPSCRLSPAGVMQADGAENSGQSWQHVSSRSLIHLDRLGSLILAAGKKVGKLAAELAANCRSSLILHFVPKVLNERLGAFWVGRGSREPLSDKTDALQ